MRLNKLLGLGILIFGAMMVAAACGGEATSTPVVIEKEVTKEVEVTREVIKEVTKEVLVVATPTLAPKPTSVPVVTRLIIASEAESETNEPYSSQAQTLGAQITPVFEGLTMDDVDLKSLPMLATDWSVSSNGLTWTFNLRENVPFHFDNGDFSTKDVKFTWEWIIREGSRVGLKETVEGYLNSMQIHNDNSFSVTTEKIDPNLCCGRFFMVWFFGDMLSSAYFDAEGEQGLFDKMVGTGPYQYKERTLGQSLLHERVPYKHWRVTGEFDEIQILVANEAATRLAMLLTREAHMAAVPDDLKDSAVAGGMRIVSANAPSQNLYMVFGGNYLPSKEGYDPNVPWTNPKVRKALNHAINRDELRDTLLGGKGSPMVNAFWDAGMPGWNPDWLTNYDEHYGYDPNLAKQLLSEVEAALGKPLDWSNATVLLSPRPVLPQLMDIGEAIYNYWAEIVPVSLDPRGDNAYLVTKMRSENLQNIAVVDIAPRISWPRYFSIWYESHGSTHFFEDPFLDEKFAELVSEPDPQKREQISRAMGDFTYDNYAYAPLFSLTAEVAVDPSVVGEYDWSGVMPWRQIENIKIAR